MKILHVIPSLSPHLGGPTFAVRAMAQAIMDQGIEVHIATTDDSSGHLLVAQEQPIYQNGIPCYYFRRQTNFYAFSWSFTRWLANHINDYTVLHIHGLFSYVTLPATYYATRAKIPYIVRPFGTLNRWGVHNRRPFLKRCSLRLIELPLLARAAMVHYTCEQERIEAKEVGVNNSSVILPLGLDLAPFQIGTDKQFWMRYPHLEGHPIILFLSRLDPKKGLELLLPAFAKVQQKIPESVLVIVGDGDPSYATQLKQLSQNLGIDHAVYWVGFLDGDEKISAFMAADVFVLPSFSENFGIAATEAMAAGLPLMMRRWKMAVSG